MSKVPPRTAVRREQPEERPSPRRWLAWPALAGLLVGSGGAVFGVRMIADTTTTRLRNEAQLRLRSAEHDSFMERQRVAERIADDANAQRARDEADAARTRRQSAESLAAAEGIRLAAAQRRVQGEVDALDRSKLLSILKAHIARRLADSPKLAKFNIDLRAARTTMSERSVRAEQAMESYQSTGDPAAEARFRAAEMAVEEARLAVQTMEEELAAVVDEQRGQLLAEFLTELERPR